MPASPGPRPDQIKQPSGTSPGDILTATTSGPAFMPPSALGSTGATGPQGPAGAGADLTGIDFDLSTTGLISRHIPLSTSTLGVTAPNSGLAGDIPTSVYVEGEERGEKLEFIIPEDYVSGSIELLASYRMSTVSAGIVLIEAGVSIADTLNGVVISSTGPQMIDFNPVDTTNFERRVVLQILEGSFSAGDVVVIDIKRLGDQVTADSHDGDWEVAAYMYRYLGQVATRATTQAAEFFLATDEPTPINGSLGAIPTSDYSSGADMEQKASFIVPDNWDSLSDAEFKLTYAMDTSEVATVRIETEGSIANVGGGTLDAIVATSFDVVTGADTGPHRTVAIRSIDRTTLNVGDVITVKVARRTGFMSNHGGVFKLINIVMTTGQASGAILDGAGSTTYGNLATGVFDFVAGAVSGDTEAPTLFGDFQAWDALTSTAPSGEIHVSYEGRISVEQTEITSIDIPIKGTGDYTIKVYVEGAVTANPVFDSGVLAAPASRTVTTITNLDLPEQPTGDGRYYVVVEAFVDTGENVRIGLPFVRQD